MRTLRYLTLTLFFLGYAILAVVGTRTKMVFQWPSYLLLGLAAVVSVGFLFSRRMKAAPGAWCLGSMLLLSGYVVVRAAASPVEYFARMDIAMVLAAVIVYLLFSIHFARSRYRALFIGLLLLLALGNMFVGLYQILRDPTYMVLPGYSRLAQPGAGGFYQNHNHLGGFLLVGSAFAGALALFGRMGPKMRVLTIFFVPVCFGGIASTASRGALLSLGVCLLVLLGLSFFLALRLYQYEVKKLAIIASPFLLIVVLATVFVGAKMLSRRAGIGAGEGEGIAEIGRDSGGRLLMWSLAIDQWQEYPVFGQGARMYDLYSMEHWPASRGKAHGDAEFAHNDYVQMLGEYGVVGLALMLFFIAAHVISGLRYLLYYRRHEFAEHHQRTNNSLAQCLGALLVLAAFAVHSMVDFNLHLPANLIPVAFAFAILANPTGRSGWRRQPPRWLVGTSKAVMPACGCALVAAGIFYARGEWHYEKAARTPIADYGEVIAHTDKSLQHDRGNFHTYRLRGTALMLFGLDFDIPALSSGFMDRAIETFEDGLEVNPYDIFMLVGMGRCLDELGEHERAEEYFMRATKLGIRSREAHLRYGLHHANVALGMVGTNLVGAIARFEQAELEMQKAWQANEYITREDREYEELQNVRRYLSHVYEEHATRLVTASEGFRAEGDADAERSYLESGLDYYSRARAGAPERRPDLNAKRQAIFDRLKELSDGSESGAR